MTQFTPAQVADQVAKAFEVRSTPDQVKACSRGGEFLGELAAALFSDAGTPLTPEQAAAVTDYYVFKCSG